MYLLDTNIVVHYLNNTLTAEAIDLLNEIIDDQCFISIIVEMECLGYNFKTKNEQEIMSVFIENITKLNINKDIVKKTIAIRKSRKIDLPDAIIAATAIDYDLILITQNTKDFKSISDLKMINPLNF